MPKFPLLTAKEFIKVLDKLGFKCIRQKGSHIFFEHPDGRTTVIPNHPLVGDDKLHRVLFRKASLLFYSGLQSQLLELWFMSGSRT